MNASPGPMDIVDTLQQSGSFLEQLNPVGRISRRHNPTAACFRTPMQYGEKPRKNEPWIKIAESETKQAMVVAIAI